MPLETHHQSPRPGALFYGWFIALCCTLVTIINGGIFYTFGVFLKPVAADFGWSRGNISIAYTVMLVAYAPAAFFAGRAADRRGPRPILCVAAALIGLGFAGCSRADSLAAMVLSYVAIGAGTGATLNLPVATVQRWFLKWRTTMVGIIVAGAGIGGFVFAPLADNVISHYTWRSAYLIIGVINTAVILLSACFLVSEPWKRNLRPLGDDEGGESAALSKAPVFADFTAMQALRTHAFWGIAALFVLSLMPQFFVSAHLVSHITDQGVEAAVAARAFGVMGISSVAGRLVMSAVAQGIGSMRALTLCYAMAAASIVWLAFASVSWEAYLFVIFYGFFQGSTIALLSGAVGEFFGMVALSELLGFVFGIGTLAAALSPFLSGWSYDLTGSYHAAMGTTLVFYAVALGVSLFFKAPSPPAPDP